MKTHIHTHTPGPWSASINSRPLYTSAEIYGPPNGFGMVAEIRASFGTDDEKAANAQLIAAAPELLQALRWSFGIVNDYWHAQTIEERNHLAGDMRHALDTMHKAISKAEGNE